MKFCALPAHSTRPRSFSRPCLAFLGDEVNDKSRWRLQDSTNRSILTNKHNGVVLRCVGSDPKRVHGRFPAVTFADELAQWMPSTIPSMLSVLQTAAGKIPGARIIYLGTRADSPEHEWERLLNGGLEYAQIHAAKETDSPFARSTWKKANPGLDYLPDLEAAIRREAKRAKQDPAALASFKALRCNMGVSDTVEAVLLAASTWREIEVETPPVGEEFVCGIDLGQNRAMSAAAAYWPDSGGLDCFAVFPETPHLLDRGRADGVDRLYVRCAERGELIQAGLKVSDVGELLEEVLRRWGTPKALVVDRWREAELRQEMAEIELRCPGGGARYGLPSRRPGRAGVPGRLSGRVRPSGQKPADALCHVRRTRHHRPGWQCQVSEGRSGQAAACP